MKRLHTSVMLLLLLPVSVTALGLGTKITEAEILETIKSNTDCERADQIHIDHLEYFSFTGDGQEEAVVVASTCMTGTAGPDIHAVYGRDASGKIIELNVAGPKTVGEMTPATYGRLFGNLNWSLSVNQGLLVESYSDTSGRDKPLVISYKWNGKEFAIESVRKSGPFKTGYDCTKAEKEIDLAICYAPEVAALDAELGHVYRDLLHTLPAASANLLRERQKQWLAQRNDTCGNIYKWWVECLTESYTKRIAELKKH
jgi:uncharacterized protein YecT (DUF1311 family)